MRLTCSFHGYSLNQETAKSQQLSPTDSCAKFAAIDLLVVLFKPANSQSQQISPTDSLAKFTAIDLLVLTFKLGQIDLLVVTYIKKHPIAANFANLSCLWACKGIERSQHFGV